METLTLTLHKTKDTKNKVVYGTKDGEVIQSVYIDKDALGDVPPDTLQVDHIRTVSIEVGSSLPSLIFPVHLGTGRPDRHQGQGRQLPLGGRRMATADFRRLGDKSFIAPVLRFPTWNRARTSRTRPPQPRPTYCPEVSAVFYPPSAADINAIMPGLNADLTPAATDM